MRRHQDDDGRIEEAGRRPTACRSRAVRARAAAAGKRDRRREREGRETGADQQENASATARPTAEDAPAPAGAARPASCPSTRPSWRCRRRARTARRASRPDRPSRERRRSPARWRRGPASSVPATGPVRVGGQGRAFVRGHAQPARALRPPKRRSRRQYSSMAARKVASSKSGQKSGQEDEFGIGRLPGQEVRDPLLARGADDQIGIRDAMGVESRLDAFDVDGSRDRGSLPSPCSASARMARTISCRPP